MLDFEFESANQEYEDGNYEVAFLGFMNLANQGYIKARISVGCMYMSGTGIQQDYIEAAKWFLPAAKLGYSIAQQNLACILLDKNPAEAIKWLTHAASNNFPFSISLLGDIYSGCYNLYSDDGVKIIDMTEAIKYYQKASEFGGGYDNYRLGQIFADGQGVEKNLTKAKDYYIRAATDGYKPAQEILHKAYNEDSLGLEGIQNKQSSNSTEVG